MELSTPDPVECFQARGEASQRSIRGHWRICTRVFQALADHAAMTGRKFEAAPARLCALWLGDLGRRSSKA